MGNSAQSVLGLLCVAALIALPTLQAANSSPDAPVVAYAQAVDALPPQTVPDVEPEEHLANDLARGGVARQGGPRVAFDPTTAEPTRLPTPSTVADNGEWVWPTPSKLITSPFGYRSDPFNGGSAFHSGIDLGDRCGTPIGSTRAGTVTFAGAAGGYGLRVVVDHGAGIWSSYSHLQAVAVQVGQPVDQSGLLGLVGTTGRSTGCHLHFEIIINGGFADPMPFLLGQPVANPSTYGNGNIPAAPISDPSTSASPSPSSPSPSASEDPCGISDDPQDALDTGGMIPVDDPSPSPKPSSSKSPCPTPSATPSASSSDSETPSSSSSTPDPSDSSSTPGPSSPTPGASSSSQTPGGSSSSSQASDSPSATPSGSESSSATPSDTPSSGDDSPQSPSSDASTPVADESTSATQTPTSTGSESTTPPMETSQSPATETSASEVTGQSVTPDSSTSGSGSASMADQSTSVQLTTPE